MQVVERIRELCIDFERYEYIPTRDRWRESMQQAVVIEMEAELARLKKHCHMTELPRHRLFRRDRKG